MYENRIPYPFYTDDGTYRKFLGIINDMSLWVSSDAVFPIRLSDVKPTDTGIRMTLIDASDAHSYTLTSDSGYIHNSDGVLSGLVNWNAGEVVSVSATLKGGDPVPWGNVYVLPIACKVKHSTPLFSVAINGNEIHKSNIKIAGTSNVVKINKDSINLYHYDEFLKEQYINTILITSGIKGSPEYSSISIHVDGSVWLRSQATCDIRISTDNGIRIGTIIEGD